MEIATDCCPSLADAPLSEPEAESLAGAFKVLADPARLRLLSLIAAAGGQEACVCQLVAPMALTQPTVSHHLKVLHAAGFLAREKRGQWAFYRLVPDRLQLLRETLVPAGNETSRRPKEARALV